MSELSLEECYREYFISFDLMRDVFDSAPMVFLPIMASNAERKREQNSCVEEIQAIVRGLSLDRSKFDDLFASYLEHIMSWKTSEHPLESFLNEYRLRLRKRIAQEPNSVYKAELAMRIYIQSERLYINNQRYDAMVLFKDDVPEALIRWEIEQWKEAERAHYKRMEESPIRLSHIFWTSRDFKEELDCVSRYRFREEFDIGEFKDAFLDVEYTLGLSLLNGLAGIEGLFTGAVGDPGLLRTAYVLWLISRSRTLPHRIRDFVTIALGRLLPWQMPEGYWVALKVHEGRGKFKREKRTFEPHKYLTALCALSILRLAVKDWMRERAISAAEWLLKEQNSDGSWSLYLVNDRRSAQKPDLFLTLICAEAIRRSGVSKVHRSIEGAKDWILSRQGELGTWPEEDEPFPFTTVCVLEFFKWDKRMHKWQPDNYWEAAKGFLERSQQLVLEENGSSFQLATVSAFHGVEAFLYSALESYGIRVFEKADRTIGYKKALGTFQSCLQAKKMLRPNELVIKRNALDRLAHLRDEIVHKGLHISEKECQALVADAVAFANHYSDVVFHVTFQDYSQR